MKHQARRKTAQPVFDGGRIPLGAEAERPLSKHGEGYLAKRRFAVVPGVVGAAGALLRGYLRGRDLVSVGCEYAGKLVTVVG
jgi:hypothetical protein